jgi:DnaK suppressor protein
METATQSHLATLRNMLTYRLAELRAEVDAAEMAIDRPGAAPLDADVRDTKDAAARASDMQVQAAEAQRDADELSLVEVALARLDAGTYGDCADCGEPIPLARLWVQPAAPRCAPCQAAFESGHGHPR